MKNTNYLIVLLLLINYQCKQEKKNQQANKLTSTFFYGSQEELKNRLDSLYENNLFDEALKVLNKLILLDSLNGELYYKKGICLDSTVPRDSIVKFFHKSADLGYRKSDCYYLIALSYYLDKDYSKCESYLRQTLAINPSDSEAQKLLIKLDSK
jgi:tetratricopeptide (TPR) repeat protein